MNNIKSKLYTNKKSNNERYYTDGDAAAYHGYVSLIIEKEKIE